MVDSMLYSNSVRNCPCRRLNGEAVFIAAAYTLGSVRKAFRDPCQCKVETLYPLEAELLALDNYRMSPNRGAGASRPKRNYTSPQGEIYFKFNISNNEICAELFAYDIAKQLGIDVAVTRLAQAGGVMGVASYDNGGYDEIDDRLSYSVKDYIHINGFIEMCLFDYLIMNEDRHAGNWGIKNNKVAPLFDHNYAFGGETIITDINNWINIVTTPFYAVDENMQRHETIFEYFIKHHTKQVKGFIKKLCKIQPIENVLWHTHFKNDCERLNKILNIRIKHMIKKACDFHAK